MRWVRIRVACAALLFLAYWIGSVVGAIAAPSESSAPSSSVQTNPPPPGAALESATFLPTRALDLPRAGHSATVLPDGNVLVAGGINLTDRVASAELYNPSVGVWSATDSLKTRRNVHSATLLPSGKVLVAGGNTTGYRPLSSSEIYDPFTAKWTNSGALATARAYHTATLLANGKVLVTGGADDTTGATLASAELFDPDTGRWQETQPMINARAYHTATLLPDGKVLVAGGAPESQLNNGLASAELYDPVSDAWRGAALMSQGRAYHTATLLTNGLILVAGGVNASSVAELYDPKTDRWTSTGPMSNGRYGHRATLLLSGNVLVTGGAIASEDLGTAELYDPATARWRLTPAMSTVRLLHTSTLLANGTVLIAGGVDLSMPRWQASAELYFDSQTLSVRVSRVTPLPGGNVQLTLLAPSISSDFSLSIYASTNIAPPGSPWIRLGTLEPIGPGKYLFVDPQASNAPTRFYRVAVGSTNGLEQRVLFDSHKAK